MNLEERLLKLEKENKKLRKYVFILAMLVLAALVASPLWTANAANSPKSLNVDKIITKDLSIVNSKGEQVGQFRAIPILDVGALVIYNRQGKRVAEICDGVTGNGIIAISDSQEKKVAEIWADQDGGNLCLLDPQGKIIFGAP